MKFEAYLKINRESVDKCYYVRTVSDVSDISDINGSYLLDCDGPIAVPAKQLELTCMQLCHFFFKKVVSSDAFNQFFIENNFICTQTLLETSIIFGTVIEMIQISILFIVNDCKT